MQYPVTTAPAAIAAPFVRAWRLTGDETAAGVLYGALGFLIDPIFWLGLVLLLGFGVWDWILGTRLAHQEDEYDDARAYNGLLSKATGIILVIGLRALVEYLRASGVPMPADMTVQAVGAILTGLLIVSEVHSIGEKQVALGSGSIAPVIRLLDRIIGIQRKAEP